MSGKDEHIEQRRQKDLQRLKNLRPIDDDFMRCIFKENIPLVEYVLRVFTLAVILIKGIIKIWWTLQDICKL